MADEVKVPTQVAEAAELAEKLFAEMYSQEEEVEEKEEVEEVEEEVEEEEEEPEEEDPEEERKWEQRYKTLQGKYDAEVPRLAAELKEIKLKLESPKETVRDDAVDDLAAFEEEYGTDFTEQLRKIITREVKSNLTPVEQRLETAEEKSVKLAQDDFKSVLTDKAPGWEDCWNGKDKGFQKFLEKSDPSGLYTYGELVELYNEKWNADKLAKVFNVYLEGKSKHKNTDIAPKKTLVAPSKTNRSTNTPTTNDKKIWTMQEINEFQAADRRGDYTPEDSQKLWNDLLAAPGENRVR